MRYALVNGEIREAERGLLGDCRGCGNSMLARCGKVRVNHWAHKGKLKCDSWMREMTDWHRKWQDLFSKPWREFRFVAEDGVWHIADVKTDQDWVLEFQHSPIHYDERLERNSFYKKLVWVVNGLRLKRDHSQFMESLREVGSFNSNPAIRRIFSVGANQGALLRDWGSSPAPVFFDFGEEHILWCLLPKGTEQESYVVEFSRGYFINFHRAEANQPDHFAVLMKNLVNAAEDVTRRLRAPRPVVAGQVYLPPRRYYKRSYRPRRHFRL